MSSEYSENNLIQESSAKTLENLGWQVEYAFEKETLGENGTFGRNSYKEVLLSRYFRVALKKLNHWITENEIFQAESALKKVLSTSSLLQINEEKYFLLRDGISVQTKNSNGKTETKKVAVFDFNNAENNHFLAIRELKISGAIYNRRADIVGFVNGVPLLFVELKNFNVDVEDAYTKNYTDYQDTIPHIFYYNAFVMLSNGISAKIGALKSKFKFFGDWKRLSENDTGKVDLETMLKGVCKKENFLDLFENFILFDHASGRATKILARNHQYLGVNEAVKKYKERKLNAGKLGVFWHTQGSGKSYSMAFFAKKILRKENGTQTFIVLTDREELNKQISGTFENCGLLGKTKASRFIASSEKDLAEKLKTNARFIFTLIQKFNNSNPTPLYPDHDIIIISDEAHRSQYGFFADNIAKMLPTAARLGFTGTPLFIDGEITKRTFGDYVSVYDFNRAVEDGATVPLYYENRGEKLKLTNPEITQKILDAIDNADLDPAQQEKVEKDFAKEIHILTAEPRLKFIAQDFVHHYSDLWESGKAMFVCLNKVTCVRMFNFAEEYWKKEIAALKQKIKNATSDQEKLELSRKLDWMQKTEMAVVVSNEQNEIQTFAKWKLDIKTHREKMTKRELDKEFKDENNPLRIVFVCAMWLTGFDVPCLSCLYLDKPLQKHTLMQTIARANRVKDGKNNGLIIDYIGIVKALREALAQYTSNAQGYGGIDPTIDKKELIEHVIETIKKAETFLKEKHFNLENIVSAIDFDKLSMIKQAANAICENIKDKKTFETYAGEINRIKKYLDRDDKTNDIMQKSDALDAIYKELNKKRTHTDTTDLMVEINKIISEQIDIAQNNTNLCDNKNKFDISEINFERLQEEFKNNFEKVKTKNLLLKDIENTIKQKLESMLKVNPERINFFDRFQQIIEAYNAELDRTTIEKTFEDLMELAKKMSEEEKRYTREGFKSDEELALYDMLFKNDLTKNEITKLKLAATTLLQKIKSKINKLDHWADKGETQAQMQKIIRDTLYYALPECYDEKSIAICNKKVYEYFYNLQHFN